MNFRLRFLMIMVLPLIVAISMVGCGPPQMTEPVEITPASFEQIVSQDKLVLLKFGATWCGPCRQVDEQLAELKPKLPSDVEVIQIDVDENPELAADFQISSIPRMMLVRENKLLDDRTGYMDGGQLETWINAHR